MTPNTKAILQELKSLANEKVRAQHIKHGAGENTYGVKLGDLRKVAARLKTDHPLAMALWETGNFEARLLAILVLNPKQLSRNQLDHMVRDAGSTQIADWLQSYVVKDHPDREALREIWMQESDPWAARAGWALTAGRVARSPEGINLKAILDRIEKELANAAPEPQWTMNTCLANIGIHQPALRMRALAIGEKLGIYRDYPCAKGCTSPFAPIWINEMVRRNG